MQSIYTLQDCFNDVSSLINKEQNQYYPPKVFSSHFNIMTGFLLGEISKNFPTNQSVIELVNPFYVRKVVAISGGVADLEYENRHLLSIGIGVNGNKVCGCNSDKIKQLIEQCNAESALYDAPKIPENEKVSCSYKKVQIYTDSEFDRASSSSYKVPTINNPIAKNINNKKIQILPKDVSHAEIRYLKHPKEYQIGYKVMPDDTWQVDTTSPNHVESEWGIEAKHILVQGITHLYSMYVQDADLLMANAELKKLNLMP